MAPHAARPPLVTAAARRPVPGDGGGVAVGCCLHFPENRVVENVVERVVENVVWEGEGIEWVGERVVLPLLPLGRGSFPMHLRLCHELRRQARDEGRVRCEQHLGA